MSSSRTRQAQSKGKDVDEVKVFPIVGIGASAGGLEAATALFKHLPIDTGFAFVLVQHLDPQHESALAQLLARATSLPVSEIKNDMRAQPNHVYVIPPNANLRLSKGVLRLQPRHKARTPYHPIDSFLESLAEDRHDRAFGVILSGTATDGTLGLEAIKGEGGITFAQDRSARYDSMPRSAIASGSVDFVLSPENIAHELARIAKHPYLLEPSIPTSSLELTSPKTVKDDEMAPSKTLRKGARLVHETLHEKPYDSTLRKILSLLRNHSGVDFSCYKSTTIERRIARRLALNKITTLKDYLRFLSGNANELDALYSDALISVTGFFRNPEAFEVLKHTVFPKLLQSSREAIRVWVLGCSTGQEAYSIAMVFAEAAEKARSMRKLQIFATDLNEALLDKARHGFYSQNLIQGLTPERVRRFFTEENGGYRVNKSLRETVVFARQDVISDPPFSRMDLISCRNVLIYLDPGLQRKIIPTFHYALRPGGFLFLGASESVGSFTDLFEPTDKAHRIFSKKASATRSVPMPIRRVPEEQPPVDRLQMAGSSASKRQRDNVIDGFRAEPSATREADRITVGRFAPPGVLINEDFQVLQFRGMTSAYLQPPTGKATFDVLKMARDGLMLPLRAAINEAKKGGKVVRKENVRLQQNGKPRKANIEVIPLRNLKESCFLVVFEEAGKSDAGLSSEPRGSASPKTTRARKNGARHIADLESELSDTREYLQSVQERQEAAYEELQVSNEEVESANEELQSINEELETSKEELESTNEELTTINDEMAGRNVELTRLNSDLVNIQTSTRLPIVLLGRDMTIRRFSGEAEKQFNLLAADVGRPFSHVRHNLVFEHQASVIELENLISGVIANVQEQERVVRDTGGRWYSLRVRPYLTVDNKVDGAVLVLVDINDLKRNERAATEARDYAEAIIRTARDPLIILNSELRVHTANDAFYRTFQIQAEQSVGRLIYELGNQQWQIPKLRRLLEDILPRKSVFNDFEVTLDFGHIGRRTMLLNGRQLDTDGQPSRILLGIQDITDTMRLQAAARENAEQFKVLFDRSPMPKWTLEPTTLRFTNVNDAAVEHYGYSHEQFLRMALPDLLATETHVASQIAIEQLSRGLPVKDVTRHRKNNGEVIDVEVRTNEITMAGKRAWLTSVNDITEIKRAENELKEADRRKNEFLAVLAHELRTPLAPIRNSVALMRLKKGTADEVQPAVAIIDRQITQMVRLVDDLLDVSRISRGKIELRRAQVELRSIINDVFEAARPNLESKQLQLTVTLPQEPIYLNADSARLAQALTNILNNAVKFTDRRGRIWVTAELENDNSRVSIRVRDTGIGIPAHQLRRIFEMFTQVETSLERTQSGLGIGLALTKDLVELHGGDIEVHSPGPGQGSEFVVRLPITTDIHELPETTVTSTTAALAKRFLIVDDNFDSASSLSLMLEFDGNETRIAQDGLEAIQLAETFLPDIVLLDIGLPRLNGYDAARRMREQPWGKKMVLVALTGWGQQEDRDKAKAAGFDAHFVKPVNYETLIEFLGGIDNR